ncbi:MAG: apolipoprotein N-acyltransferase [Spirochaetaceae bacterium]|nr:MAG: apolipoprotein N-acyltransferase [Spirochaetaceae bacterium]
MGLIILGALLFTLAFPNVLVRFGLYPVAFIAIAPVAVAIQRMRWWMTPLYGALYGFLAYALFNYWLFTFHPLAIFIVPVIYAAYFFVLFPLLWAAGRLFGRTAFLVQALVWLAYEYLRIRGFLGYAYGIMGYSLFPAPLLIQTADFGGVWSVSALVVLPSFFIAQVVRDTPGISLASLLGTLRKRMVEVGTYALLFAGALIYGVVAPVDYSDSRTWNVALVQQNVDPWVGGFGAYRESLDILLRQSRLVVRDHTPDIVVWSETSFVPSIDFHTRYRQDQERYELVRELREFLAEQTIPYVIGNSDGQLVRVPGGDLERRDYNAVLLFGPGGVLEQTYRKIHLVPFTEHFPYEEQLPWMHRMLVEANTNFWETGQEWTVFEVDGIRFSTPICFEDTFGYLSRGFVQRGAEVIVNLTNDLWSYSEPSAMQHMGMAVFRAVENRRSVVRSTNGGMTTIIDPNGRLLDLYPPFKEGFLVGDVPVYTGGSTLYTAHGDWLAYLFTGSAPLLLLAGVLRRLRRRT